MYEKPNDFCMWATPITVTDEELDTLSERTLYQIDEYDRHYITLCGVE